MGIASKDKWLKVQGGSYFHTFLQPQNVAMQKRFFDRYLKGIENGWENEPRVEVQVRAPGDTIKRTASGATWPLPNTKWTNYWLDAGSRTISPDLSRVAASATAPASAKALHSRRRHSIGKRR